MLFTSCCAKQQQISPKEQTTHLLPQSTHITDQQPLQSITINIIPETPEIEIFTNEITTPILYSPPLSSSLPNSTQISSLTSSVSSSLNLLTKTSVIEVSDIDEQLSQSIVSEQSIRENQFSFQEITSSPSIICTRADSMEQLLSKLRDEISPRPVQNQPKKLTISLIQAENLIQKSTRPDKLTIDINQFVYNKVHIPAAKTQRPKTPKQ